MTATLLNLNAEMKKIFWRDATSEENLARVFHAANGEPFVQAPGEQPKVSPIRGFAQAWLERNGYAK